jgi:hypothetical protein
MVVVVVVFLYFALKKSTLVKIKRFGPLILLLLMLQKKEKKGRVEEGRC